MTAPRSRRRGHGPLFWRVYLHGVLLLVLVALSMFVVGRALGPWYARGHDPARFALYFAGDVAAARGDPARLERQLARLKEVFGLDVTLFDAAGRPQASNVAPPLAALSAGEAGRVARGPIHLDGRGFAFAAPMPDGRGYLLVEGVPRPGGPTRAALQLLAVLVVLALASIPFARSIASPLERLTRAARALGAGDLTVRANLRARGEVGELAHAFDEMAERLERLVRGEKELLANVSHELRTPLARIRVALELAAEGDLERARRYLAEIGADLDELDRLIDEVLTAARLELGAEGGPGLPLERAPVDLGALLAEVARAFREDQPDRALELELAPALAPVVGDAALLRRLVRNLLDNARKYSEAPAPILLASRGAGDAAVLEVRDHGIGIDAADLPRLFTPFFRTDRSRARGTGGVGLGLTLAKRIAEAHGGTISVESAPGEGTVVRVTLPAAASRGTAFPREDGAPPRARPA